MTSPGGSEVGRVSVKVLPDTSRFSEQLRAELQKVKDDFTVDVSLNTSGVMAEYQALKKRIESRQINAQLNVDRSAVDQVASGFGQISGAAKNLGSAFNSASRPGRSFTRTLASMAGTATVAVPLIATLSGAILAAGGAITAGLAGLPVVLTSAIAPAGAVALGIEGIKEAAKTLKPEVDSLRSSLENTFERTMLPIFKRLKPFFPALEDGLTGVAKSFADLTNEIVSNSLYGYMDDAERGINLVKRALSGVSTFLDKIKDSASSVFDNLLRIAGTSKLYEILGDTIDGLLTNFALFLSLLRNSGTFTKVLGELDGLINALWRSILQMAGASLKFIEGAAPGLTSFFADLSAAIAKVDWKSLGESFGETFRSFGEGLKNMDGQALRKFVNGITSLGKSVKKFIEDDGLYVLLATLKLVIDTVNFVIWAITGLYNAINIAGDTISDFWDLVTTVFTTIGKFLRRFPTNVSAYMGQFSLVVRQKADDAMDSLATSVQNGVNDAVNYLAGLPGKAVGAIGDLGSELWSSGASLIEGFISGMQSQIPDVGAMAQTIMSNVRAFFPFSPAEIGPFSGRGYTTYSGRALVEDFAEGIEAATPRALREVENLMQTAQGTFSADIDSRVRADDFGISGEVFNGVMSAFDGGRLRVDGDGFAQLVNEANWENRGR